MRQVRLGQTGLSVSAICLGTMTWGSQNSEAEGHAQMDRARAQGVNFWDTAEMYPVNPVRAETVGRTEEIIGTWLAARGGRDELVLATKVTGEGQDAVRGGAPLTGAVMRAAVEDSLRRLQTDYIDLYQLHWPNRAAYHFRDIWHFDPRGGDKLSIEAHMFEILQVSADLIAEGKIRHIALSNESVWGAARWLALAEKHGLPRMMTVQNEYSLLCRQFDSDWAELSALEDMPLLAFSPLATGLLTGKYAGDVIPEGSRRALNPTLSGRVTPQVFPAVAAYLGIAARHGLNPAQMAIAFCMTRPHPCIPIIGATNLEQLELALGAADLVLDAEVLAEIEAAHRAHPMPY
ncbi:NADP-dependent oxidoreductase [Cypionkella aquatica]|uniref:NADP-dependent oxidoreductase n=1 Tax=Cypionkella aquatica TaxID=1756042 RepID=A0AA37U647_9RHOB|nr:aldo/keto reductase [Cypionkella aquatica]GLS88299.1 NADP-dependent oxidoreductase [Cypionkella aquatica]